MDTHTELLQEQNAILLQEQNAILKEKNAMLEKQIEEQNKSSDN